MAVESGILVRGQGKTSTHEGAHNDASSDQRVHGLEGRTVTHGRVVGSGLQFDDRGIHELTGVPGERRLFAVASG